MTPDCDLQFDALNDNSLHDDSVTESNCAGRSASVFFYFLAVSITSIGVFSSIRYNFPSDGATAETQNDSPNDEKSSRISSEDRLSSARVLSKDTPLASSLLRFQSYFYQKNTGGASYDLLKDSVESNLNKGLLN